MPEDLAPPAEAKLTDEDFSWLLPEPESPGSKLTRKVKENPFVPLGCGLTVLALVYGLAQFKRGHQRNSQMAMRMRVLAQGGTLIALLGGLFFSGVVERRDN